MKEGMGSIPSQKFYDIRRKVIKDKHSVEIDELIELTNKHQSKFDIINHWKHDKLTNNQKYNGSSYISKRARTFPISYDILFMDDTTCMNNFDFPLIVLSFEDYNKIRQLFAFGFIPGREAKDFAKFLNDIKKKNKSKYTSFHC